MSTPEPTANIELLTFQLDTEIVAVRAVQVREILDQTAVTQVPGAPAYVSGLINVRGQVIPLADLRLKLDLEARPPTQDSRIIVLEALVAGEPLTVGVRADKVFEVTELAAEQIETAPRIGMRWHPEHIRFVGKRGSDLIIAIDVDRIFSDDLAGRSASVPIQHDHDHGASEAEAAVQ